MVIAVNSYSQSWDQIKADTQNYITGEGWGETIDEADQQALSSLISKLSVVVSSNFEMLEGESREGTSEDYKKYIEDVEVHDLVNNIANLQFKETESLLSNFLTNMINFAKM